MIGSRKQKSAANSAPPEASGLVRVEASLLVVLLSKDPPQSHARTHALETSGEPKCVTAPMAPSWKLFVRRSEKRWSFTDCTSFVLMDNLDLRKALAFDRNFVEAGFAMIP